MQKSILVMDTASELKKIIPGGTTLDIQVRLPQVTWGRDATAQTSAQVTRIQEAFRTLPGVNKVSEKPTQSKEKDVTTLSLYAQNAVGLIPSILNVIHLEFVAVEDLHFSRPTLENVFIYLTGRNIRT